MLSVIAFILAETTWILDALTRTSRGSRILPVIAMLVTLGAFGPCYAASPESMAHEAEPDTAKVLRLRYEELCNDQKYTECLSVVRRACDILERKLGRRSVRLATCLSDLGLTYDDLDQHQEAEKAHERALSIRKTVLGYEHSDVAESLNNLGGLYEELGEYRRARDLYGQALSIWKKTLGVEHAYVAIALNNLATTSVALGEYDDAIALHQEALAIRKKTLGDSHPKVAQSLNNIAYLSQRQGKYADAISLYEQSLTLLEAASGPDSLPVANGLNNLGSVYLSLGDLERAELLLRRALSIQEAILGPDAQVVARTLNNLGHVHLEQGNYAEAAALNERALSIRKQTMGSGHPDVANSLENLARVYEKQGRCKDARPLLEEALSIHEAVLGLRHPHVGTNLDDLAVVNAKCGPPESVQPLLERALEVREQALGRDHADVANTINNLANMHFRRGDLEEARPLYERAIAIHTKALGADHPRVAVSLNLLGRLLLRLEGYDAALAAHRRALDIEERNLARNLLVADERRRFAYAATMVGSTNDMLSLHLVVARDYRPAADLALTTLLRRKGRVQDLTTNSIVNLRRSLPNEYQYMLDEVSSIHTQYSALASSPTDRHAVERVRQELEGLRRRYDELWSKLAEHGHGIDAPSARLDIDDVQAAIPPGGVLLEFVQYSPRHEGRRHRRSAGPPRYAVYMVTSEGYDWVDLGAASTIDEHVEDFRDAIILKRTLPTGAYDAIMAPALARLGRVDTLFIAPDGALNLLPFGALYDGKRYLIEGYSLRYVTTGRDLLRAWSTTSTDNDTVLVVSNPTGAELPGTEQEADILMGLFSQVRVLEHDDAAEALVQQYVSPWILHFGTHGFFQSGQSARGVEAVDEDDVGPTRLRDNPMLYSGLLLSTYEDSSDGRMPADDGRLTAYEVSSWDLRGTELVFLSACETGLGDVQAGEGVLGLRRAFAIAGAQTQVMSLWRVSDANTAQLVEAYYRRLSVGKARAEALQEVQLEMLNSEQFKHPRDWASFVVVGEWGPLSRVEEVTQSVDASPPGHAGRGCCRSSIDGDGSGTTWTVLMLAAMGRFQRRRRTQHRSRCHERRAQARPASDSTRRGS